MTLDQDFIAILYDSGNYADKLWNVDAYGELAPGAWSLTAICTYFPKIVCTLPVLEDIITFRFAWSLFYSRDHEI